VRSRAKFITAIRGSLRAHGYRLGSRATRSFDARWATVEIEESLGQALDPLVETIAELSSRIEGLDREPRAEARSEELPLKQWSEQLQRRVGKAKAAVGVARKLAILMHRLWITGESYRPFP
jgi:vacuolar-type H+-ATPase subunit I/STV1